MYEHKFRHFLCIAAFGIYAKSALRTAKSSFIVYILVQHSKCQTDISVVVFVKIRQLFYIVGQQTYFALFHESLRRTYQKLNSDIWLDFGRSPNAPMFSRASMTDFERPLSIWNSSIEMKSPF